MSGYQYLNVTGVGTAKLIYSRPGVLGGVCVNSSYVGTVMLYDTTSASPGTADTLIATIGTPSQWPQETLSNIRVINGLVYAATGTPDVTIKYD